MWLVGFIAALALLVVLNIGGIKPHEAGGTAHKGQTAHGGTSSAALHGQTAEPEGAHEEAGDVAGSGHEAEPQGLPDGAPGHEPQAPPAEYGTPAAPGLETAAQAGDAHSVVVTAREEGAAGGPAGHEEGQEAEGEAEAAGGPHGPEAMLQAEGLPLNYYPQGSHTYNLSQWLSGNRIGRWLLGDGLDWLHRAEGVVGFWALFGVLVALILVRVSKGAAHTFLGKGEDFYDR